MSNNKNKKDKFYGFSSWRLYKNNISDLDKSINLIEQNTSDVKTIDLSDLNIDNSWSNISYTLKLVTVGSNGFYSNIRAIKYAPVHENSHVLKSSGSYDKYPKDYTQTTPTTLSKDSGVSIKSLNSSKTIYMSYQPIKNSDQSDYLSFTNEMPYVMYVKAGSSDLAVIKFISSYLGDRFYIYDDDSKKLYYGTFNTGYEYKGDGAYSLTEIENYDLNGQAIIK